VVEKGSPRELSRRIWPVQERRYQRWEISNCLVSTVLVFTYLLGMHRGYSWGELGKVKGERWDVTPRHATPPRTRSTTHSTICACNIIIFPNQKLYASILECHHAVLRLSRHYCMLVFCVACPRGNLQLSVTQLPRSACCVSKR
jgi:hypothetical protein